MSDSGSVSRSLSPINDEPELYEEQPAQDYGDDASSSALDESCYELSLSPVPPKWTFIQIKDFLKRTCQSTRVKKANPFIIKQSNDDEVVAKYENRITCKMAYQDLQGVECDGKPLTVKFVNTNTVIKKPQKFQKHESRTKQFQSLNNFKAPNKTRGRKLPGQFTEDETQDETYGLSMDFLDSLGITLPLQKMVFVHNLCKKITEANIRDVFGLAGQIVSVEILKDKDGESKGMARIGYDHPVEAVQAISLLRNQVLYGKPISIQFDAKTEHSVGRLPKGLQGIGTGLGPNGSILKGVRVAVEILPVKAKLEQAIDRLSKAGNIDNGNESVSGLFGVGANNGSSFSNPSIGNMMTPFGIPNPPVMPNMPAFNMQMPVQNPQSRFDVTPSMMMPPMGPPLTVNTNLLTQVSNPMQQHSTAITPQGPNLQALQGFMSQVLGVGSGASGDNINATLATLRGQNTPPASDNNQNSDWNTTGMSQSSASSRNNSNYESNRKSDSKRSYSDRYDPHEPSDDESDRSKFRKRDEPVRTALSSDMLVFSKLPPSVTVKALIAKMKEVGELKFAEITGQGRAIVRFLHVRDAERCMKLFHHSKVDGQIIEVNAF